MSDDKRDTALNLTCGELCEKLDAYFEGEDEPGFRAHAEKCSSCGALLADFQSIRSAATGLPLESPAPRVWSNVRATLEAEGFFRERESFWEKWIAQFRLSSRAVPLGAAVLVIALAIFLVLPGSLHKKAVLSAGAPLVVATAAAPSGLTAVEANLVQTVQQMEDSYKAREAGLDPVAKQTYERGLASLDGSIHECLVSLHEQPRNTLARQYLMQAYTEKADILASALEYDGR
ncbi:MAG TPA: anti-sigma factor [Terriglobia bacterium]|nr:anti-sigma factor [Terriglobia bacterium]